MSDTFYVRTFGCQMNDHDSERIAGLLEGMGLSAVDTPEDGDVLVYNTCSIREKADTRLLGHLGTARRLKTQHPGRLVIVAGCLAQSRREAFFAEHPYVDVLVGPQSLHRLPSLMEEARSGARSVGAFEEATSHWSAELPRARRRGPAAWMQIMAGCSNYCSYCIVPYVRGPEASRDEADIIAEAEALVADGVREITLLGQNVNAYGLEPGFTGSADFAGLLRSVSAVQGVERIRFMTSHPKDVSGALIEVIASCAPVCEHLHLPVQSGSDRILRSMRRGYDRAGYLRLVERLREAVPGISLTTDVIVGFPEETEDDFADTLSLMETVGYDAAFTFHYSPRRRTAAADLPGRVEAPVLEDRMGRLVEVTQLWGARRNAALVGEELEVLVEGRSRRDEGLLTGRTRTHKTVNFRGEAEPGDLVTVLVDGSSSTSLRGEMTHARAPSAAEPDLGTTSVAPSRALSAAGRPEKAAYPAQVVALFGPTGVGKTAVAVELAMRLGVRVISCDSMQIYQGFPVLTNQPDAAQLGAVRHEFVAVADPEEEWNAADYGRRAQAAIDEDVSTRGRALIAGGTGLYLRAALAPLAIPDVVDPQLVERLRLRAESEGADSLHRDLRDLDPEAAARIPVTNVRRVIRALEVAQTLGPGRWSGRDDLWTPQYRHPTILVLLTADRPELYRRVNARAVAMLERGAVEEVRRHEAERGGEVDGPPRGVRRAIGYGDIAAYLQGDLSLDETAERLAAATRRYIRRQTTWMRKLEGAVIIDASRGGVGDTVDRIMAATGAESG